MLQRPYDYNAEKERQDVQRHYDKHIFRKYQRFTVDLGDGQERTADLWVLTESKLLVYGVEVLPDGDEPFPKGKLYIVGKDIIKKRTDLTFDTRTNLLRPKL